MSDPVREIFRVESEELIAELENGLVRLESEPEDEECVNRVFRAAHTLKGNGDIIGDDALVEFAHLLETLLVRVRVRELAVSAGLVSDLLAATDVLKAMIDRIIAGDVAADVDDGAVRERLMARVEAGGAGSASCAPVASAKGSGGPRVYRIRISLIRQTFATGQDPYALLADLKQLGTVLKVETNSTDLPALDELDPYTLYLTWTVFLYAEVEREAIEEHFAFVDAEGAIKIDDVTNSVEDFVDLTVADQRIGELLVAEGWLTEGDVREALGQQKPIGRLLVESGKLEERVLARALEKQDLARTLRRGASVRVSTSKLDGLLDLVGELVIAVAQVSRVSRDDRAPPDVRRAVAEGLERITRDLQEQVTGVRMIPVEESFSRFRRIVRDLARDLGKEVELVTRGNETELDKTMIEQLTDPLKHMLRNCVDHGLEPPEEREAAGKPRAGTIRLEAEQREGRIIVRIRDDGRGISREKVLAKAISSGLVERGAELSDRQVFELLFHPGLSTAAEVTDVSGRGVGLDVVKRNIESVSGTIDVHSVPGQGTVFEIHLPLTLAIIDGMTVRVGAERLTFPLANVVELVIPSRSEIRRIEEGRELVHVRDGHIPLVRLSEVFSLRSDGREPEEALVVVLDVAGRTFGVLVDEAVGIEQAVVKSLDTSFNLFQYLGSRTGRPRGIAGATILSDGSVSLIVDVYGLQRASLGDDCLPEDPAEPHLAEPSQRAPSLGTEVHA